jgi:hypothetical protein
LPRILVPSPFLSFSPCFLAAIRQAASSTMCSMTQCGFATDPKTVEPTSYELKP